VLCERHEANPAGAIDCPDCAKVRRVVHGGERNVRVIKDDDGNVISRRLIVEVQDTTYEVEPSKFVPGGKHSYIGDLRREAARVLQRLGVRLIGDLRPDPTVTPMQPGRSYPPDDGLGVFDWREVDRIEGPGLTATTSVIVTDDKGRPRFDPALVRSLTVTELEVHPTTSLDEVRGADDDKPGVTLHNLLGDDDAFRAQRGEGIAEVPTDKPILPNVYRRVQVAVGRFLLGIASPEQKRQVHTYRRDFPESAARLEREVAAAIDEAKWEELLKAGSAKGRVSPVPINEAPTKASRRGTSQLDQKDRPQ
jgi:hypothetical protein